MQVSPKLHAMAAEEAMVAPAIAWLWLAMWSVNWQSGLSVSIVALFTVIARPVVWAEAIPPTRKRLLRKGRSQ